MKILLTGQSGQIGGELSQGLLSLGEVIFFPRAGMDLSDLDQVRDVIRAVKPDLIVNTAGHTAVAKAESEPALAMLLNRDAPRVMAQEAQRLGAAMVQYSTDYVFDGELPQPYAETAQVNPLNVYGRSKAEGEQAVMQHCETYWILRTSWVYHASGNNFMNTVIRLAQQQPRLAMVADQIGAPTWARTINRTTCKMLSGGMGVANTETTLARLRTTTGIYHLTASGETSWYDYAALIVERLRARGIAVKVADTAAITPMPTPPGALPRRPKNSRLALAKLESTFGLRMPHWHSDALLCLDEIVDRMTLLHGNAH